MLAAVLMVASLTGCSSEPDYRVIRTLDGLGPTSLIAGKDGNLYGTLEAGGGKGQGLVFKLKPDGTGFEVLHHSSGCLSGGADGSQPYGVIEGSDGTLYGTTRSGGVKGGVLPQFGLDATGNGTVFKVSRDGTGYQVLHALTGRDGDGFQALAGLVEAPNGTLYGTTLEDSAEHGGVIGSGHGTVFTLNKDGSGYRVLYTFGTNAAHGHTVWAKLLLGSHGALYGTTHGRGAKGSGTLFSLKPDGSGFRVLHSFPSSPQDGGHPCGALVLTAAGGLDGMTSTLENQSAVAVFRLALHPSR